ncbi:DUF6438 domain-containing protein [Aurantiacibacter spongiae]|uniref:DUF6438 domain-containing protein n=1 Tax=Aurantiacibacter spongiae TaxID=2488860 RepID=A0A3N5DMQ8_9SPHN|nr:DUF6438 domain-containing protein [Aurantiacibacter spongiae]RPF70291.1 hypothetical protein EG799_00595 [Aurantiacibacter spongiae]
MKPAASIAVLAFSVAACATTPVQPADVPGPLLIFETGPCFGFCPVFAMTVSPDGRGQFTGTAFTAVLGERNFEVTPAQYEAFRLRLAPYRPDTSITYGYENCDGPVATDAPTVTAGWSQAGGESVSLEWYMGCRQPGLAENPDAIYGAWRELPAVARLVGFDDKRATYGRGD